MTVEAIAEEFFTALSTWDTPRLRRVCSPTATRWVNIGNLEETIDELLGSLDRERAVLRDPVVTADGWVFGADAFVVRITCEATTVGGRHVRVPACLVVSVDGGLVTRIHEYADSASARPIIRELFPSLGESK